MYDVVKNLIPYYDMTNVFTVVMLFAFHEDDT